MRGWLRERFFGSLHRLASRDETREIFSTLLQRHNAVSQAAELSLVQSVIPPYSELQRVRASMPSCRRPDIIFVTGRFRSGSTLLWNLFRSVPHVTAYYEPFNERRWFDGAVRGTHIDATHLNVSDYWSEYDGLEELGRYFSEQWKFEHLYMTQHAWNPDMQRYIEILVERAPRRPVLQFNEVDMRLPWLRAKFPAAEILHVFRHPRDQWCSTLQSAASWSVQCTLRDFEPLDGFYLLRWAQDLRHYYPFLTLDGDAPAYELFYQIWKLSFLFGHAHANLSIAYEEIVQDPRASIRKIFSALELDDYDLDALASLVSPVRLGKWRERADDSWFQAIEARVDEVFECYASSLSKDDPAGRGRADSDAPAGRSAQRALV